MSLKDKLMQSDDNDSEASDSKFNPTDCFMKKPRKGKRFSDSGISPLRKLHYRAHKTEFINNMTALI